MYIVFEEWVCKGEVWSVERQALDVWAEIADPDVKCMRSRSRVEFMKQCRKSAPQPASAAQRCKNSAYILTPRNFAFKAGRL